MPIDKDFSVEDEAYLATVAVEPKMTMDEVGADIDEHGHIPVNHETATIDPFSAKGSLAYALDEDVSSEEAVEHATADFRDETKGEVEGTTSTPQGLIQTVEVNKVDEGQEPTIQQDKAVCVKDSLSEALDSITMDGAEEIEAKPPVGKDPEPDYSKYSEEDGSHVPLKAPEIPTSMGGDDDKPDENGLVYVSATFTVDPDKYVSNNYRPANMGKMPDAAALLKQKSGAMNTKAANPEEEAAISDLGTPEAKESAASPDEPTEQQEKAAAKEADKEQQKELEAEEAGEGKHVIPTTKGDKQAADAAPESVVLDYATFIDGSSFMCFDEVGDIDYTKIAMDAGPKKPPTRANCQTTFAQCRAKNPLFCRFHGPKLLEADIKTAIKATVGPGCVVQVTKDKNSKNKFTFRLTVGCPPSKKKMVEKMVHMYLTQNPGISSSTEDWNLVGKHKQTTEFEMDILQADKPPKKDTNASQALSNTKMAKMMHKKQAVVGETAPALEKKAEKGEKWETVDEAVENEWADLVDKNVHKSLLGNNAEFLHNFDEIANQFDEAHDKGDAEGLKKALEALKEEIGKYDENGEKKPEAATVAVETQETTEEPAAPETPQTQAEEPKVEKAIIGDDSESSNVQKDEDITVDGMISDIKEMLRNKGINIEALEFLVGDKSDPDSVQIKVNGSKLEPMIKKEWFDEHWGMLFYIKPLGNFSTALGEKYGKAITTGDEVGTYWITKAPSVIAHGDHNYDKVEQIIKNTLGKFPKVSANLKLIKDPTGELYLKYGKTLTKGNSTVLLKLKQALNKEGIDFTIPSGYWDLQHMTLSGIKGEPVGFYKESESDSKDSNVEAGIEDEQIIEYYDGHGKLTSKPIAEASEMEKMLAYNKLLLDAAASGAFDNEEDHKKYDYFYNINHNLHPIEKTINEMKEWISGMKKKGGETGGGETVVLPSPKAAYSGKVAESSQPPKKDTVKQTPNSKANELASKLSGFKAQLDGMIESGIDAESVNSIKNLMLGAQVAYDKLAAQYEDISEIDAQYAVIDDLNDISGMDKNFKKQLIDDAKSMAEGTAAKLLAELESKVGGIESALAKAGEKAKDVNKVKAADDVEETIKGLSAYIFGGKRPPHGVDSVTDYLDYKKDEMESAGEGASLSPEEMAKMAGSYHLNESYDATKAASNAMDAAVAEFKGLMDSTPEQGEDNETYMKKVEAAQKKIKSASSELMANFDAYKQALEKCKYDVEAAKKLAESKKKLEGGGIDGEGGGEVTKADLEDFFDSKFADNDQELLNNWLELANHGTWEGKSPNNFFTAIGGAYQKIMEKKGANHPVTKALVKAGLNLPKSMEQKNPVAEKAEEAKPAKQTLSDEQKKAIIAAMSPKQKLEAAVKIFKKKLAANPTDSVAKAKLAKYEAMLSKLSK